MDPIELTAKSLDEGKKLAAEKLGVSPDQVEVKVLEETKGLFGRTSYKLSATSTASSSEAPAAEATEAAEEPVASAVTKPTRARKKPAPAKDPEEQIHSEHVTLETAPTPAPSKGAPRRLGKKSASTEEAPAATAEAAAAPAAPSTETSKPEATVEVDAKEESAPKADAPKRLGRGRKSEAPVAPKASEVSPAASSDAKGGESASTSAPSPRASRDEDDDEGVVATQEQADRFRDLLQNLLNESGLAVELRITGMEGKYVNLAIDDAKSDDPHRADSSYLIGRSGEVLNALQYLANLIGKQQFNDGVRVVLDGAGWREKREAKLQEYTLDVVRQVLEREEEALLDALPAFERRIVHRIVQDIDGVKTYSEGEEPNRRVVISPA